MNQQKLSFLIRLPWCNDRKCLNQISSALMKPLSPCFRWLCSSRVSDGKRELSEENRSLNYSKPIRKQRKITPKANKTASVTFLHSSPLPSTSMQCFNFFPPSVIIMIIAMLTMSPSYWGTPSPFNHLLANRSPSTKQPVLTGLAQG